MLAAQNNADWYAMMWDIRGLRYIRDADGFRAIDPPPPYHGWVTCVPGAPVDKMIAPLLDQPGFAVKDGSGVHDLEGLGLCKMFDASWLFHSGEVAANTDDWEQIRTPAALNRWEEAWADTSPSDQRQFPDAILDRADVRIWGRRRGAQYDAGVIANLSDESVGLSNAFGTDARPAATALCASFGHAKPVVGYERSQALAEALVTGWHVAGSLAVWGLPR
jgi:hypothetical protein